ncbi:hypothetical protein MJI20_32080, partial [Salmonella enterica subsp. enterica serovar Anatum]|nr:hypothetical protein [Salmonella enterica subsp. enterica serovar Anatum]
MGIFSIANQHIRFAVKLACAIVLALFIGFIDTNVILFVAMFIVGGALFETGMANKVGGVITRFAKTEKQ